MKKFKINISLNGVNREFTCVNHNVHSIFAEKDSYGTLIFYFDGEFWNIIIKVLNTYFLKDIIKYFETDKVKHYIIDNCSIEFKFPIEEFDMQTFLRPRIIK